MDKEVDYYKDFFLIEGLDGEIEDKDFMDCEDNEVIKFMKFF